MDVLVLHGKWRIILGIALFAVALLAVQARLSQSCDRRRRESVVARSAVQSICEQISMEGHVPDRMKYMVLGTELVNNACCKPTSEHIPEGKVSVRIVPVCEGAFKVVAYGCEDGSAYEIHSRFLEIGAGEGSGATVANKEVLNTMSN